MSKRPCDAARKAGSILPHEVLAERDLVAKVTPKSFRHHLD
jgi:hypothetical protein